MDQRCSQLICMSSDCRYQRVSPAQRARPQLIEADQDFSRAASAFFDMLVYLIILLLHDFLIRYAAPSVVRFWVGVIVFCYLVLGWRCCLLLSGFGLVLLSFVVAVILAALRARRNFFASAVSSLLQCLLWLKHRHLLKPCLRQMCSRGSQCLNGISGPTTTTTMS